MVFCTDFNCGTGSLSIFEGGGWHSLGVTPIFATSCGSTQTYYWVCAAGYTWLDRNLGASRVATSSTDYQAYGSLYQWGRQSDSHQCITWTSATSGTPVNGTTTTQCSSGTCANALYVTRSDYPIDWNNPTSNILWNGTTKGANDPCPSGYRVPSQAELTTLQTWVTANFVLGYLGFYFSPLKMPVAGSRNYGAGALFGAGSNSYYWSSTYGSSSSTAYNLYLYIGGSSILDSYRAGAFSVRCIAQ